MKRSIACVHTSPAALGPVSQYYAEAAPDLKVTNMLDDGILRLFAAGRLTDVQRRLGEMLAAAQESYAAEAVLLTCSSVTQDMMDHLRRTSDVPVLKIDQPMAHRAVEAGERIGVLVTFPVTLEPTSRLLKDTAAKTGTALDLVPHVVSDAYDALLSGDADRHDALLVAAIEKLAEKEIDAIVLAQVSMARVLPKLKNHEVGVPVYSSLDTSLTALREILAGAPRMNN